MKSRIRTSKGTTLKLGPDAAGLTVDGVTGEIKIALPAYDDDDDVPETVLALGGCALWMSDPTWRADMAARFLAAGKKLN